MRTDFIPPTNGAGYSAHPVTKAPDWHGLVAWDLLFNNLTTGLFLVAALGELAAPAVFTAVAKTAYPVALVLLLTDLSLLVLDLGDPLRFHHMLRVFKPSSPMSLGTWCLTAYSLPLTLLVALDLLALLGLLPRDSAALGWVRTVLLVVGLPFAFGRPAVRFPRPSRTCSCGSAPGTPATGPSCSRTTDTPGCDTKLRGFVTVGPLFHLPPCGGGRRTE